MVRTPAAPIYTERIPPELATNETWMLHGRKARPRASPTAYFRPPDYVAEYGPDLGIPLYRYEQTREYHPRPPTVASQQYYDIFVTLSLVRGHRTPPAAVPPPCGHCTRTPGSRFGQAPPGHPGPPDCPR